MLCAICDDDYGFLRGFKARVEGYCRQQSEPCDCRLYLTPTEFLLDAVGEKEAPYPFDVIFLNIDLGWWDGINIARTLRGAGSKTIIIFVSSLLEFAPDGYSVGAFRYLMKDNLDNTFTEAMDAALAQLAHQNETLQVKCGKDVYTVPLRSIVYAESSKRTVTYALQGYHHRSLTCYRKLSDLEQELGDKGFLRIQKSFLVNMQYIDSIRNYIVTLKTGESLQASRQSYKDVVDKYHAWLGGVQRAY